MPLLTIKSHARRIIATLHDLFVAISYDNRLSILDDIVWSTTTMIKQEFRITGCFEQQLGISWNSEHSFLV